LCSTLSIVCNIVLVIFKFTIGVITNSIAIQADGLNNLSDVGSNLASFFGFKLANKHPDETHPYGHGRVEYVAGLIIAFLILFVSILIKLWMASFNRYASKKINSATLLAASQDSLNDVIATLATLISLILSLYTDFAIDGIMGAIVSLIVLKAGIEIFKDTVDPLLGMAPDKDLIKDIE